MNVSEWAIGNGYTRRLGTGKPPLLVLLLAAAVLPKCLVPNSKEKPAFSKKKERKMKNNAKSNAAGKTGIFYPDRLASSFWASSFYSKASVPDLKWILAPTSLWVRILSGIPFDYEPGSGYVSHSFRFIIAPSLLRRPVHAHYRSNAALLLRTQNAHTKKRNMLDHTQLPLFPTFTRS